MFTIVANIIHFFFFFTAKKQSLPLYLLFLARPRGRCPAGFNSRTLPAIDLELVLAACPVLLIFCSRTWHQCTMSLEIWNAVAKFRNRPVKVVEEDCQVRLERDLNLYLFYCNLFAIPRCNVSKIASGRQTTNSF